jgi:acyl-CoA thioester hydrolase
MPLEILPRDRFRFFHPLRVRYSEVDAQKIVFNGHYLNYYDVGLHEFLRSIGCDYHQVLDDAGADSRVAHTSVNYMSSHVFDEALEIAVRIGRLGNSSTTFDLATFSAGNDRPASQGQIVWVVTDRASGRPTRMPAALRDLLSAAG